METRYIVNRHEQTGGDPSVEAVEVVRDGDKFVSNVALEAFGYMSSCPVSRCGATHEEAVMLYLSELQERIDRAEGHLATARQAYADAEEALQQWRS
jgi:hypothetical protein